MIEYGEIYDYLRKEKYSDQLQPLPKNFISQFSEYTVSLKKKFASQGDLFDEEFLKEKKQLENSISLFREIMLRRKKKILSLVFVASETGIMKRDFGNMLKFEQETFEGLVSVIDKNDKSMNDLLNGKTKKEQFEGNKMIIINEDIEEFVDMSGNSVGPFEKGELVNLDDEVANILVSGNKAKPIEDK